MEIEEKLSCNLALPFQKLLRVLYFHGANQGQDDSVDFRVWVSLELKVTLKTSVQ
ncbi:hypothetical protein NC652_012104 [Populus alba x Populus x berolinensis]|nr:hypothetical protein NC652_012104 [Populus alba x Populus x berolinensis]